MPTSGCQTYRQRQDHRSAFDPMHEGKMGSIEINVISGLKARGRLPLKDETDKSISSGAFLCPRFSPPKGVRVSTTHKLSPLLCNDTNVLCIHARSRDRVGTTVLAVAGGHATILRALNVLCHWWRCRYAGNDPVGSSGEVPGCLRYTQR